VGVSSVLIALLALNVQRLDADLQQIFNMTMADAATGRHLLPSAWVEQDGTATELVSYSYPIAFSPTTGELMAAITIDFKIADFSRTLRELKGSQRAEAVLLDTRGNSTYLAGSNDNRTVLAGALYQPTMTPVQRTNDFMTTVYMNLGNRWTLDRFTNFRTFIDGGMQYDVAQDGSFLLVQRTPLMTGAKAAAGGLNSLFEAYAAAARAYGNEYLVDGNNCYNYGSVPSGTTEFIQLTASLQQILGSAVVYTYMSYAIPSSAGLWGDCGCEIQQAGAPVTCYYVDTAGMYYRFNGTNIHDAIGTPTPFNGASQLYIQNIMNMTAQNGHGVWQQPAVYTDMATNMTFTILTYTIPLVFDPTTHKCILATSIDVRVASPDIAALLMSTLGNSVTSDVVLIDTRGYNATFLGSNIPTATFAGLYAPDMTPNLEINQISMAVKAAMSDSPMAWGLSWSQGGLLYNVEPFWNYNFAVIERRQALPAEIGSVAAESQGVQDAAAILNGRFGNVINTAKALGNLYYNLTAVDCREWNSNTQMFLVALNAALQANGWDWAYAYVVQAAPEFTICGCSNFPTLNTCDYVDNSGTYRAFNGTNWATPIISRPYNQNQWFIQQILSMTRKDAGVGAWSLPEAYFESQTNETLDLLTYAFPLTFNGNNVSAAIAIDFRYSTIQRSLQQAQSSWLGEQIFADIRGNATVLSASAAVPGLIDGQVYPVFHGPSARINDFAVTVSNALSMSMSATQSFTLGAMQYNIIPFSTNWLIAQRTPMAVLSMPVVVGFYAGMEELTRDAVEIGTIYQTESAACYDLMMGGGSNFSTTGFLQSTYMLQTALGGQVRFAYVSYQIPGTNGMWGDCGCELHAAGLPTNCFFTDRNGTYHNLNASNLNQQWKTTNYTTQFETYTQNIMNMTSNNLYGGIWQTPQVYTDPASNLTSELLTFSTPLAFDPITGKCILAASVDIDTAYISAALAAASGPMMTNVVIDTRGQGTYVASSIPNATGGMLMVYPALNTPNNQVNLITRQAKSQLTWLNLTLAYSVAGTFYTSFCFKGVHSVISMLDTLPADLPSGTDSQSVDATAAAIGTTLGSATASARALADLYQSNAINCVAPNNATQQFFNQIYGIQTAYGYDVAYAYITYRDMSSGRVGDCGCQMVAGQVQTADCYYMNASGYSISFVGPNVNGMQLMSPRLVDQSATLYQQIFNLTTANASGAWLIPEPWTDPSSGEVMELVTFTVPIFDMNGTVIAAASIDFRVSAISRILARNKASVLAETLFIDTRGTGNLIATSDAYSAGVFMQNLNYNMQNPRVLNFLLNVYSALGDMWLGATNFTTNGMKYSVQTVFGSYLLAQRTPETLDAKPPAVGLNNLFIAYEQGVNTVALSYSSQPAMTTMCHDYAAFNNTNTTPHFFESTMAQLETFGGTVVYSYLTYRLPGTSGNWGDCGCEKLDMYSPPNCFFTDRNGTFYTIYGANVSAEMQPPMPYPVQNTSYAQFIMNLTWADRAGVWGHPHTFQDPVTWNSFNVVNFVVPFMFVDGVCVGAASFDIRMDSPLIATMLSTNAFSFMPPPRWHHGPMPGAGNHGGGMGPMPFSSTTVMLFDARNNTAFLASSGFTVPSPTINPIWTNVNPAMATFGNEIVLGLTDYYMMTNNTNWVRNLSFPADGQLYTVSQVRGPFYVATQRTPILNSYSEAYRAVYRATNFATLTGNMPSQQPGGHMEALLASAQQKIRVMQASAVSAAAPPSMPPAQNPNDYANYLASSVERQSLQAAASGVQAAFAGKMAVAQSVALLYSQTNMIWGTGATAMTQAFLDYVNALEKTHSADIAYIYVSARDPTTGLAGDCGCGSIRPDGSAATDCFFTYPNGTQFTYAGTNFAGNFTRYETDQGASYLREIFAMKEHDFFDGESFSGKWLTPYAWTTSLGNTVELISYSFPIAFNASGDIIAAATVDFRIGALQAILAQAKASPISELALLDIVSQRVGFSVQDNVTFLGTSDVNRSLVGGTIYMPATTVPVVRVSTMISNYENMAATLPITALMGAYSLPPEFSLMKSPR
jgi:hypothetical protein